MTPGAIDGAKYFYRINANGTGSGFGNGAYYITILQQIENGLRLLGGKTVTVSFYIRSDIAGRIVALVHEKLKEVIVPGITTKQIDEICEKVIRDNNATPSFLHLYGFPNSVCTSINEVVVHGIPSDRKLEEGDIISVDVGACYKG